MRKSLFPLLLGGLGIGTTEFVMMGLLPDVAADLRTSIPTAGRLISAYALGVVVGAPLLVMVSGNWPPKRTLLVLLALFTLFNGLSALAPSHAALLFARFLSGLPHGAFFGVGAVVAARLADEGRQARAIASMFAGLTIANLVVVPLGTWIGHHHSWRYTFALVAAIGATAFLFLRAWLPEMPAGRASDFRTELRLFRDPQAWLVVLVTAVGTAGLFCWISYIAPLMTRVARFRPESVPAIMVLVGLGMVVGNLVGGPLADRFSPARLCAWMLAAMAATLAAIAAFSGNQVASLGLTFVAGALSMAIAPPIQVLMMGVAKEAEMLGAATTQSAFNVANSLGALLGGLAIAAGFGYGSPPLVGAVMALLGVVFAVFLVRMRERPSLDAANGAPELGTAR